MLFLTLFLPFVSLIRQVYTQSPATPAGTLPTPTALSLPPVSPKVQAFIDELSTAILYASLISNDGDTAGLCSIINPSALSKITSINGTAVKTEVCNAAVVEAGSATLADVLVTENQKGVSYLATALYAVQVAGNFAGGTDLSKLCSEIDATLIDDLFIAYIDGVGTAVKDFICGAAKSASSGSASKTTTPTTSTPPTCTSPQGFANTVVPVPDSLTTNSHFQVAPSFGAAHQLFEITDLNILLSEASYASFCLDQCIAYRSATGGSCLSLYVNFGKPYPPEPSLGTVPRWYCKGYDAPLSAAVLSPIDVRGSFLYGLVVNRVCNGTYRAY